MLGWPFETLSAQMQHSRHKPAPALSTGMPNQCKIQCLDRASFWGFGASTVLQVQSQAHLVRDVGVLKKAALVYYLGARRVSPSSENSRICRTTVTSMSPSPRWKRPRRLLVAAAGLRFLFPGYRPKA